MKKILFAAVLALGATSALAADDCDRDILECGFTVPVTVNVPLDACGDDLINCKTDMPEAAQFCVDLSGYGEND